jgi:hypothetical protein
MIFDPCESNPEAKIRSLGAESVTTTRLVRCRASKGRRGSTADMADQDSHLPNNHIVLINSEWCS